MSARENLRADIWEVIPDDDAEALIDAYRAEVLAEAKVETVAWLAKKATEQKTYDAAVLASKVDRGAVRAFLGTGHYRDAMDAHRVEVLTEAAAELDRIADTVEARVAEHYGPASGIGPGSAQMLRDAAGNVRYMARKDTREGESTTAAPDFFQPGHAYTHRNGSGFRCVTVTAHPNTGERRALGWIVRNGWHEAGALDPDDWTQYDGCEQPADKAVEPATVEFSDGTVTLTHWDIVELAPDYYGHTFMQIGGWLPKGWEQGSISHGTNHMVRADLPGTSAHTNDVNVQIEVKGYGGPRRYMKIQWRHAYGPAKDHRRTGGEAR